MKLKAHNLEQLNEDCLDGIFEYLNLTEQYALLKLSPKFAYLICRRWQRKYANCIDFIKERQLKLLHAAEIYDILQYILPHTKELRYLNSNYLQILNDLLSTQQQQYSRYDSIQKLTVLGTTATATPTTSTATLYPLLQLQNLNELQLLHYQLNDINELAAIFNTLPLHTFISTNALANNNELRQRQSTHQQQQLALSLQKCHTLHTLKVNAIFAAAAIMEILKLPHLQQLTIYTNDIGYADDDDAAAAADDDDANNSIAVTKPLQHIVANVRHMKYATIYKFHLRQSHFNRQCLQQLYQLPNLKHFAWHAFLDVERCNDATLKWQAYDTQLTNHVLQLIVESANLKYFDFRQNCHVTNVFVQTIREMMRKRYGYDDGDAAAAAVRLLYDDCGGQQQLQQHEPHGNFHLDLGYFEFVFRS